MSAVTNKIANQLQGLDTSYPDPQAVTTGTAIRIGLTGPATVANLKGKYSSRTNFWLNPGVPQDEFAAVDLYTFDGKGKVTSTGTRILHGVVETLTGSGTYTMNVDGSGSHTIKQSDGSTFSVFFVINTAATKIAKGMQGLGAGSNNE